MRAAVLVTLIMISLAFAMPEIARAEAFVPVCERSEVVRFAIERMRAKTCEQISEDEVARVGSFGELVLPRDSGWDGDYQLRCGDFSGMSGLKKLRLAVRQGVLPECLWEGLENLELLVVQQSPNLISVPDKAFARLRRLRTLVITQTGVTVLPDDIFFNLDRLEILDLAANKLSSLANVRFSHLTNLRYLTISNNKLKEVPVTVFDDLNLEHIFLTANPFQADGPPAGAIIAGHSFIPVCQRSPDVTFELVYRLNKSCDQITEHDLLSLVDLSFYTREGLKCGDLSGLKSLKYLDLQWGRPGGDLSCLFADNQNLISLRLEGDVLSVPARGFSNLKQLRRLRMQLFGIPRLDNLPGNLFESLIDLRYLHIHLGIKSVRDAEQFTRLDERQFMNQTELKFLRLIGFRIGELPDRILSSQENLRHLNLSQTGLARVERVHFQKLRRLTALDLSGNHIEILPEDLVADLSQLEQFDVASNSFRSIPRNFFATSLNLEGARIGSPHLQEVPDFTFVGLPRLERVDVDFSPLRATSKAAFKGVPEVIGLPERFPVDRTDDEWGFE